MVSKQYGLKTSINRIHEVAGTDKQGINIYGAKQTIEDTVADAELMLPFDKSISGNGEFGWKKHLFLSNVVKLNYTGTPVGFQSSCDELSVYLRKKAYPHYGRLYE